MFLCKLLILICNYKKWTKSILAVWHDCLTVIVLPFNNPRNFLLPWWFAVLSFLAEKSHFIKKKVSLSRFKFAPYINGSNQKQVTLIVKKSVSKQFIDQSLCFSLCISLAFQIACFITVWNKSQIFPHFCRMRSSFKAIYLMNWFRLREFCCILGLQLLHIPYFWTWKSARVSIRGPRLQAAAVFPQGGMAKSNGYNWYRTQRNFHKKLWSCILSYRF